MTPRRVKKAVPIEEYRRAGDKVWRRLGASAGHDGEDEVQKEVQKNKAELSEMLLASLQMQHLVVLAGSGCSISAGGPTMAELWECLVEDDEATVSKIAEKVGYEQKDKNIEALLSKIEAQLYVKDDAKTTEFLNRSKTIILEKCSEFLCTDKLGSHKIFLHRLSKRRVRDQRLKVFTTNYDRCFEQAASELGCVVLDGFSFTAPRRFDPRFFSYDIVRRSTTGDDPGSYLEGVFLLYKLHGSVNWTRDEDGSIQENSPDDPQNACMIYPARGKYQQSYTQPYLECMSQYLAALREPNTCVVVAGFGFNDDHLSEPLIAAVQSNPHLRLIIVSPSVKRCTEEDDGHWAKLSELGEQGEDVWFIAAKFDKFAKMIPDLKSLTPADTLMKAIRNATREK